MRCKPEDCCNCTGECLRENPAYNAAEEELNGSRAGSIIVIAALTAVLAIGWAACARADQLYTVNREVNRSMSYQADEGDHWDTTCPAKGDCEDFALCKARKLLEAGIEPSRMAIVWELNHREQSHSVLQVDDVVLDSLKSLPQQLARSLKEPVYACHLDGNRTIYVMAGGRVVKTYTAYKPDTDAKCVQMRADLNQ